MIKIATTGSLIRVIAIFIALLPMAVYVLLNLLVNQLRYFLNTGFIIFFLLTILWFIITLRLNFFHYDVYIDKGELVLKRPFTHNYYENPKTVQIFSMGQLTLFLFIYKVVGPKKTYWIKIPPESFKERLNPSLVIQRFREKIDKLIDVNEL